MVNLPVKLRIKHLCDNRALVYVARKTERVLSNVRDRNSCPDKSVRVITGTSRLRLYGKPVHVHL